MFHSVVSKMGNEIAYFEIFFLFYDNIDLPDLQSITIGEGGLSICHSIIIQSNNFLFL